MHTNSETDSISYIHRVSNIPNNFISVLRNIKNNEQSTDLLFSPLLLNISLLFIIFFKYFLNIFINFFFLVNGLDMFLFSFILNKTKIVGLNLASDARHS